MPAFTCPSGQALAITGSTCISRRSRSAGTSVLTFAQRVRRLPRRSPHPVPALRRARSGALSAIHAHAHVQSHLNPVPPPFGSSAVDAVTCRPRHLRNVRHLSAPTIPRCRAPLEAPHLSASDLAWCSLNTLTARVHIQRIVIEKVGSLVSEQTALLELSRLPTKPPGLRSPRLSSLPPPSRKISSVRLAALPFR